MQRIIPLRVKSFIRDFFLKGPTAFLLNNTRGIYMRTESTILANGSTYKVHISKYKFMLNAPKKFQHMVFEAIDRVVIFVQQKKLYQKHLCTFSIEPYTLTLSTQIMNTYQILYFINFSKNNRYFMKIV